MYIKGNKAAQPELKHSIVTREIEKSTLTSLKLQRKAGF